MDTARNTVAVLVCSALTILIFCGFSQVYVMGGGMNNCIKGNDKRDTESRKLDSFNKIRLEGAFNVELVAGRSVALATVTAENNLIEQILTQISQETLVISAKNAICANSPINIRVDTDSIEEILVDGASDLKVAGIDNHKLSLIMDGSGTVIMAGVTRELNAELRGSSGLLAAEMPAGTVRVRTEGAASAHVYAQNELHAVSGGASQIMYSGTPRIVAKDESGASEIIPFAN